MFLFNVERSFVRLQCAEPVATPSGNRSMFEPIKSSIMEIIPVNIVTGIDVTIKAGPDKPDTAIPVPGKPVTGLSENLG
jgi:hypothetical protein